MGSSIEKKKKHRYGIIVTRSQMPTITQSPLITCMGKEKGQRVLNKPKHLGGTEGKRKDSTKGFCYLAAEAPVHSYVKITQLPSESFLTFVERLCRAIELQVWSEDTWREILKEVALANADSKCRATVLNLPLHPPPTLQNMLEICARKVTTAPEKQDMKTQPPQRVSVGQCCRQPSTVAH